MGLNPANNLVSLDNGEQNVSYPICNGFRAVAPDGANMSLAQLRPGDFVKVSVAASSPCLVAVSVLAPPTGTQCSGGSGFPSYGVVAWEGFNERAHSVISEGVSGGSWDAWRWCSPPTVVGANGVAILMSQIPVGTTVRLWLSATDWVTGVSVGPGT